MSTTDLVAAQLVNAETGVMVRAPRESMHDFFLTQPSYHVDKQRFSFTAADIQRQMTDMTAEFEQRRRTQFAAEHEHARFAGEDDE